MGLMVLSLSDTIELGSLEGLGKLKNLIQFTWTSFSHKPSEGMVTHIVGQLPLSLKILFISGEAVVLGSDFLAQCYDLSKLELEWVEASSLDLSNCRSLESVTLKRILKLQTLLCHFACQPSSLQSLSIDGCKDLVDISRMNHLISLKKVRIEWCPKLEVPNLLALTELPDLELRLGRGGVQSVVMDAYDSIPCQLRELSCYGSQSMVGLNLDGFNQLEVLDLSFSDGLTSLERVGDLLAL